MFTHALHAPPPARHICFNLDFDYNTVEQVLLMCSIFLSLVAIMFESGEFYSVNPTTGIEELTTDPTSVAFYNTVLVFGSICLIGSLVYYTVVFFAEVLGHVPDWVRNMCASKKSRMQKQRGADKSENVEDEDFIMADGIMFSNPARDLEAAKKNQQSAEARARELEEQLELSNHQQQMMVQQAKRLKAENQRHNLKKGRSGVSRTNTPKRRKEMQQVRVGENAGGKGVEMTNRFATSRSRPLL